MVVWGSHSSRPRQRLGQLADRGFEFFNGLGGHLDPCAIAADGKARKLAVPGAIYGALLAATKRYSVDLHRRGAAPQLPQAKVLAREALEIREPLQRVARDEELALEVSRRLFDA